MKTKLFRTHLTLSGLLFALFLAALLLPVSTGWCQASKPDSASGKDSTVLPSFDVVSVKESNPDYPNTSFNSGTAGLSISGAKLPGLLKEAYGLYNATSNQIVGLPPWANQKKFNIQAKVSEEDLPRLRHLTREQSGEMLRGILADRFHLMVHEETKILPTYDLVLAKSGSKLTDTNAAIPSPATSKTSGCYAGCMSSDSRHLDAKGVALSSLAGFLTFKTGRLVLDQTGLTGTYDFSLDWSPEEEGNGTAWNGSPAPTLFTAIQEQLGVKLQASRAPVKIIVIDSVTLPSAN